MDPPLAAELQE